MFGEEAPIVRLDFIYISGNLVHDPAFVQTVNAMFVEWLKANGADGPGTFEVHCVDSDGCPNQYDCAVQYYWIGRHLNDTGIRLMWAISAPAHGKGPSDEACGGSKAAVLAENMLHTAERPTRIESIAQVRPLLERVYQWPSVGILKKKGKGTMRRFIFDVPVSGPGHVKRPVVDVHTVVGSKPMKQFMSPSSVEASASGMWMYSNV